jgi:hypothetical protein
VSRPRPVAVVDGGLPSPRRRGGWVRRAPDLSPWPPPYRGRLGAEPSPDCTALPFTSQSGAGQTSRGHSEVAPTRRMSGGVLLSHAVSHAVPSAQKGLASGFGMGPGVSPSLWPPKLYGDVGQTTAPREPHSGRVASLWQVLGLLVLVSSIRYRTSTSSLSTRWSSRGPYSTRDGRPHLEASFPLRCFQRLSLPNVANQQCRWHDNWHTRGSSVPVLSY